MSTEMASSNELTGFLNSYSNCLATFGVVAGAYLLLKLLRSICTGLRAFVLARPLGLSLNLKACGEWAVVTGATDGIGKAFAFELARRGMSIVLISRTPEKLEDVANAIKTKHSVKTKIIAVDFSKDWEPYDIIKKDISGLDIGVLVNNVGISYEHPEYFGEIENEQRIRDLVTLNITTVTKMSHIVLPGMVERRRGVIINMSSGSGARPTPLLSLYSAAKAFTDTFSRALQIEYKSKGITVQSCMPFFVTTKLSKIRRASLMVPTPEAFVKTTLGTVGVQGRTYGCIPHALQGYFMDLLPTCVMNKIMLSELSATRKRALRKKEQKKE